LEEITKILDAAELLFKKYGIRSVTMSDIARELGVSKKTLYVHIENKHDLIAKIMQRYIQEEQAMCQQVIQEADNALDELLRISIYVQHQIKDINPSMIYDLQKYHRPIWKLMDDFHQDYIMSTAESNLQRGVEEGIYRKDLNIQIMAKIYVSFIPILSDDQVFPLRKYPTSQIHKEFIKYHIYGIVSEKGSTLLKKLLAENKLNSIIL
jgi:AcrR family transcriptional regulator